MGEFIQNMFEAQMLWNNDSTVYYFTGRDAVAIIIGFLSGAILVNIFRIIDSINEERKKK